MTEIDRDERILRLAGRLWLGHYGLYLKKLGIRSITSPDYPFELGDTPAEKEAKNEANARKLYFYELASEIVDWEDEEAWERECVRNGVEPPWKVTNPKHDPQIPAPPGRYRPWKPKDA